MTFRSLKNEYAGERLFLIGTGPSLNDTPLELLQNEYTFAFHNITEIYESTKWRPDLYLSLSPLKYGYETELDLDIPCFFPDEYDTDLPSEDNVYLFRDEHISKEDYNLNEFPVELEEVWSTDVTEVVYRYNTVLYPAMQIASYLGFREFYLIGCDLYEVSKPYLLFESGNDPGEFRGNADATTFSNFITYLKESEHVGRSAVNAAAYQLVTMSFFKRLLESYYRTFHNDPNHFGDSYWGYDILNHKRNQRHIENHTLVRELSDHVGIKVYNATLGGQLEVHPRVDLNELVKE